MKRTDITALFPTATDEQIKALMDINGADINTAKKGIDDLTAQLTAAKSTITELEKAKGDSAALQKQIDDFKAADAKRQEAEKAAATAAAVEARFSAVLGEKKFTSDYTRKGVLADFTGVARRKQQCDRQHRLLWSGCLRLCLPVVLHVHLVAVFQVRPVRALLRRKRNRLLPLCGGAGAETRPQEHESEGQLSRQRCD